MIIVENMRYFFFKIYLTEKKPDVTAAILRIHLWHASVYLKHYEKDVSYLSFKEEGQRNVNAFNPKCKTQQYNLC